MLADEAGVVVVHGDGRAGWPDGAPFDAIHVAAAAPDIPPALLAGVTISHRGDDAITVTGTTLQAVAQTAHDHDIVLHELTTEHASLEETFFALTTPSTPGGVA